MNKEAKRTTDAGSLKKAKRTFLLNLVLFSILAVVISLYYLPDDHTPPVDAPPKWEQPAPDRSLKEEVNLLGQMLSLAAHPKTLPDYETEWVMKVSRKHIKEIPEYANLSDEMHEELAIEFFNGYTECFYDYFDDSQAREAGYAYGLKFDPMIHGAYKRYRTKGVLEQNRTRLEKMYNISNEAEWYLFSDAFDQAFASGLNTIKEGVTRKSIKEPIELFED